MEKFYYNNNPIVKKIFFKMLIPTILMNLTTALASFADTMIIGKYLDDATLSVVTFATPIYMIINTFAALYAVGGSIVMSVDSGKGDKTTANKAFSIAMELIFITSGILVIAGIFFGDWITKRLGAGPEVFELVRSYSTIVLIGAPVFMINIALAFFVRNDGRPVLSMIGMFLSIAVNIVMDIVFIGYMNLGVAGAAYATVLGQLVSAVVIASHFFTSKNTLRFSFTMNKSAIRILKNGMGTALHFIYQFITILIINNFVERLGGNDGVVVYTVVFNLCTVSLALFEGFSQTIQPMISLYYGEQSHKNISDTIKLVFKTILVICGTITIILEIVPGIVPTLFNITGETLMSDSVVAIRIYATSMIIMTINVILGYYLQSTEQSFMASFLVSLRCLIVFLISVFVLGRLIGINGVWASYTVTEVVTFGIFILMNMIKRRQLAKKDIVADVFLLDTNIRNKTYTYTFSSAKDDFGEYKIYVLESIKNKISDNIQSDIRYYLTQLENIISDERRYIEVEINSVMQKAIIRDNLDHGTIIDKLKESDEYKSKYEYVPVFGWNRVCLERGD